MKSPLLAKSAIAIGLLLSLVACDQKAQIADQTPAPQTTAELAREAEFTPWMSRAGLQIKKEQSLEDQYFATVEGRLNAGENQYRAILRNLDLEEISNAFSQWGLSANELFDWELSLLKRGAERAESQVFTDSTGQAIYQLVMIFRKDALALVAESSAPIPERVPEQVELRATDPDPEVVDFDPELASSGEVGKGPTPGLGNAESSEELAMETRESTSLNPIGDESAGTDQPLEDDGGVEGGGEVDREEAIEMIETPDSPENEEPGVAILVDDPEAGQEIETSEPELDPIPVLRTVTYKVMRGDTLSKIARQFKVSIQALKKANGLRSDLLKINQVLKVPSQS